MINGGIINTVAAAAEVCTTNNSSFPVANTAYYKLDGDAIDSSGNGYNGTSPNVTWGVGRFGPAGVFNGSSSYISTGINFSTLPNTKSISMWIKSTGSSSVGFGGVNGSYGNNGLFSFDESAGNVAYIPKFGGYHTGDASTIITNAWNHFVVTDTNVDGNVKIYINGSEVTVTKVNSVVYTNNTNMQIGRQMRNNGATFWQTGEIDQVRIFNTVLTANQVTELYEDEIECCTTDEVNYPVTNTAYYQLNGGTGTTVVDETGTYNATSTNVTYGAGLFDDAAVFNGSSSYITTSLKSKNVGTLSFWFKGSTPAGLVTLFNNNNVSSNYKGVMIQGQTNGTLRVYIAQGNGIGALDIYTTNTFFDNNWHNAVLTWDLNSSGTNTYLYVDNVVAASGAANTGVWTSGQDSSFGLFIGAGRTNLQFFNGSLDQVRIFPTAITAGQVAELYQEKQCVSIVPSENFNVVLYEGNETSQNITTVGFDPDMIWLKNRDIPSSHLIFDVQRSNNYLIPNLALAEDSSSSNNVNLITGGFSLSGGGTGSNHGTAGENDYVAWCWKADGAAVTNTIGTITSQVSANTEAGFSIVSYTGTGTPGRTFGHGLNQAPELIIPKNRDENQSWVVGADAIGKSWILDLANSNPRLSRPGQYYYDWNDTTITTGSQIHTNGLNDKIIAYCFHSVDGYQKVGSYQGNSVSGRLIDVGFRVRWVMIKATNKTSNWFILDSERGGTNDLRANASNAEESRANGVTFVDDGFELDDTSVGFNDNTTSYIYLAIA